MAKQKQSNFFLIFGLAWIVLCVPFLLFGRIMIFSEQRFEAEGVKASATLTGKNVETNRSRDRETNRITETQSYYLHYSFETKEGRKIEAKDTVAKERWEELAEGAAIEIQYLPGAPEENRISRESSIVGGVLMCCFAVLGNIIGIGSIVVYLRDRFFGAKLKKSGILADATITSVGPGSLLINSVPQWQIQYTYTDLSGRTFKGRSKHMPQGDAQVWRQGDKGKIRFDPVKPQRSIWIGKENPLA